VAAAAAAAAAADPYLSAATWSLYGDGHGVSCRIRIDSRPFNFGLESDGFLCTCTAAIPYYRAIAAAWRQSLGTCGNAEQ
jgi:hypothetical protein